MPYRFNASVTTINMPRIPPKGERYSIFYGETIPQTASVPDGYARGGAFTLPIVAGGLSSWQAVIQTAGAGDLLQGGPLIGTATLSFTADNANASLIITLSGTGSASFTGDAGLALTIGLGGDGAISITGGAGLSMIVPVEGTGVLSLTGSADLKGDLSMSGSWGGATPLSPEALADAVWAKQNANAVPYGTVVTSAEKAAKLAAALSA
jgi:hypothetical protein